MLRLRGENLFVERGGFAHMSGSMVLQREREDGWRIWHGGGGLAPYWGGRRNWSR